MDYELGGLPLHILVVHAVVVFVPLAALCTVATMFWPAARRRLGVAGPVLGLAQLGAALVAQLSGQWLLARVAQTPLITAHAAAGLAMLPWSAALFGAAVLAWAWTRPSVRRRLQGALGHRSVRVLGIAVGLVVLGVCVGAVADLVLVGDGGARAVWLGNFSKTPIHP